ncbi:radical SAM/SPASM domain-containing protein [Ruminococcus flavefaciens]|uniref:radical SAM protein n=1 Tax=Ruminococcus flavefaciens TaxID=1265 RepID=UPI0026F1C46C|nr:radical SAM/SPASM domain-containing protein [Ruminococcus flavefaciens]
MLNEMSIEIIRKCPNNCVHCSSNSSICSHEIIPLDLFCEVVQGAKEIGLKTVCFSGGEPFLHLDFLNMVEFVNDLKLNCYIYTSGIFVDHNNNCSSIPLEILKRIYGKVTKLIFNMPAATDETYNLIMQTKGNFKYLQQSIIDASSLGILCESHFVPMKLNVSEIEQTIELCSKLGVSKISFLRLVIHGRALFNENLIALTSNETNNLKDKLLKLSKSSSVNIRIGVPLSEGENKYSCEAADRKLNIRYDGNVYPCEVFKNNKVKFIDGYTPDNIFKKDIKDIYLSSNYLCTVRRCINDFSGVNTCENCIGQYYIKNISEDVR